MNEQRKTISHMDCTVNVISANTGIDEEVFNLEFPARTIVDDLVLRKKYQTPTPIETDRKFSWFLMFNFAAVIVLLLFVLAKRLRRKPRLESGSS